PKRLTGAVAAAGANAGIIASSSGRATAVPIPRSIVRRERDFLVTNIFFSSPSSLGSSSHFKWRALDDSRHQRPPPSILSRRIALDFSNGGGVVILQPAAQRVGQ